MKQSKQDHQVIQQDLALDVYLKTLLEDIPATEPEQKKKADRKESAIKPQTAKKSNFVKKPQTQVSEQPKKKAETVKKQLPLSVMPDWAQHEFQALFFKVDQLVLAIPLTELLRTIKNDRKPTKIPGQPSWFMGLLDELDSRIGILDSGQLLFGKKRGQQRDLKQVPYQSILITQDGKWGLACDEVLSISRLSPENVRWRTFRDKRPWLVGTVIDELVAVIDVEQLVPHRKAG